jgi:hypothetical protein
VADRRKVLPDRDNYRQIWRTSSNFGQNGGIERENAANPVSRQLSQGPGNRVDVTYWYTVFAGLLQFSGDNPGLLN